LAVGQELRAVLEIVLGISPGSLSIQQVFYADLLALGLAIKETPYFIRSSRLALFRLSDLGRQACRELGWSVVESGWERLIRSHEGLLAFCWQARLRDWRTALLPRVTAALEPDLLAIKGGVDIYAEFEIQSSKRYLSFSTHIVRAGGEYWLLGGFYNSDIALLAIQDFQKLSICFAYSITATAGQAKVGYNRDIAESEPACIDADIPVEAADWGGKTESIRLPFSVDTPLLFFPVKFGKMLHLNI